jgi:hypothetical protein
VSGKENKKRNNAGDRSFFSGLLGAEEALSRETGESLYFEACEFMMERPWEHLTDEQLILVDHRQTGERCYCCVMGAAGEWCGVYVYRGDDSYRLHTTIAAGRKIAPFGFYEKLRGVSMEIVRRGDLDAADRELLKALKHPARRNVLAPQFRAVRPGYMPWYVTEEEGKLLRDCLRAVNIFCIETSDDEPDHWWQGEHAYPLISLEDDDAKCRVQVVKVQVPEPAPVVIPELDEERVQRIAAAGTKSEAILEAEHFCAPGTIGEANERKACLQLSVIADATTGFLYQTELGLPGEARAAVVSRALLASMEAMRAVPREVRVRERELGIGLAGLGTALGFEVKTVKKLPMMQEAKEYLFKMLESGGLNL